jgi:type IX secretion system PorP/SprF family membrane protein
MNKGLKIRIILFVNLIILFVYSEAQDIHFSQVHTTPLLINPASTGIMESTLRLTDTYRNQWRQLDFPYVTNYLSVDGKMELLGRSFGIGAYFLHDEASNLYLTADKIYFSISHSLYFRNNQFAIGLQPGWVLKSLDSRQIIFGSQFDPDQETYDPGLPSGEGMLEDKMNYFDMNIGLLWRSKINRLLPGAGISVHHINRPVESFYNRNDSSKLPAKVTVHGSMSIPIGEKYRLIPLFLYCSTSGSVEFLGGLVASYHPNIPNLAVNKLFGMAEFRMDPFQTVDALIIGVGMGYSAFDLCISYDFTTSSLSKASGLQRAFEISLVYNFNRKKRGRDSEPCFML